LWALAITDIAIRAVTSDVAVAVVDSELSPVTPEIETEIPSLKLRLVREEDAEELYLRVDQNREHLRWRVSWVDETTTKSDTLKFVRFCLESAVSGTGFHYVLPLDGEIVGLVAFNSIEKINRCATIGYWLAKSQTGRGLMTMAARNALQRRISTVGFKPNSSEGCYCKSYSPRQHLASHPAALPTLLYEPQTWCTST
jgi:hypothetical protein